MTEPSVWESATKFPGKRHGYKKKKDMDTERAINSVSLPTHPESCSVKLIIWRYSSPGVSKLSVKGQIVNILDFEGCVASVAITQLRHFVA